MESGVGITKHAETYKHRGLPHGKDLTSLPLKEKLTNIFEVYAASSEKLAPLGSSQRNESFDNIVASKTPKSRHYRGSESNDFRVAAVVCQQNIGHSYLVEVCQSADLSPGQHLENYSGRLQSARLRSSARKSTPKFKHRRLQLRQDRVQLQEANEVREGTRYETGCILQADVDKGLSLDVEQIPDARSAPQLETLILISSMTFIVAAVETTDTTH